jgi:CheY-specific phosphatase CheX
VSIDFTSPFLKAAKSVLAAEMGTYVHKGAVAQESIPYTLQDVTVLLSVVGDIRGIVLYSMDTSMALAMVSCMLGERQEEFDELAQSGIAEVGNRHYIDWFDTVIVGCSEPFLRRKYHNDTDKIRRFLRERLSVKSLL